MKLDPQTHAEIRHVETMTPNEQQWLTSFSASITRPIMYQPSQSTHPRPPSDSASPQFSQVHIFWQLVDI